ncbi:hypothetical protein PV10_04979 [Exophiala mesophila]|uniref:ASTRA-associated protein 1 n=1 Tax=Exophiala mesophila TaxID=212818 RepID=A0A0D1XZU5_EXOME|nr:uncharacterized protein PV10_04979 [Exophiala mesophila]KIV93791.1 hypothetical protein PV10_04979 [Exophiala mesophila]
MESKPPLPKYILRGHTSTIHALEFFASNELLVSGDGDGWVIVWNVSSKRPVAVWHAHKGGVMQIKPWADDRLVTHGRDHALRVWQVRPDDYARLSTKLPSEGTDQDKHLQPWLLHSLAVNALNFCPFAICEQRQDGLDSTALEAHAPQLIASPNGLDQGGVDLFQLPSEHRISQLKSDPKVNTGMVMAVQIFYDDALSGLMLISGYEDGQVMAHVYQGEMDSQTPRQETGKWVRVMQHKPHSQPVLSLSVMPSKNYLITSSADATIARFALEILQGHGNLVSRQNADKVINTKHAGQQGLSVRSDGKIFATAGWDSRVRVYSSKTMQELAVLKWHKDGCYATAFADVGESERTSPSWPGMTESTSRDAARIPSALETIKHDREEKARRTHWLAAGGKDGKISLWDVF